MFLKPSNSQNINFSFFVDFWHIKKKSWNQLTQCKSEDCQGHEKIGSWNKKINGKTGEIQIKSQV